MLDKLICVVADMTNNPVRNYVTPGLTSSLVGGDGYGKVRLFSADRDTREWVTPHSHRFNFACLVLEGVVENIIFEENYDVGSNMYAKGTLHRLSDDAFGKYEIRRDSTYPFLEYTEKRSIYHAGDIYSMYATEIHSIRFSRDCKVLFFEGPDVMEYSEFLEPYSNGEAVHTFETKEWMFQR